MASTSTAIKSILARITDSEVKQNVSEALYFLTQPDSHEVRDSVVQLLASISSVSLASTSAITALSRSATGAEEDTSGRRPPGNAHDATHVPASDRVTADLALHTDPIYANIQSTRDVFHLEIKQASKHWIKPRDKKYNMLLTEPVAQKITTFFYDDMMGQPALDRLKRIIHAYQSAAVKHNQSDPGAAKRAAELAADPSLPSVLRVFFNSFAESERDQQNSKSMVHHMRRTISGLTLLRDLNKIKDLVNANDREIQVWMSQCHSVKGRGRGNASVAYDCLAYSLKLDREQFYGICQRSKSVEELCKVFGDGIIPLLPAKVASRICRFGLERLRHMVPMLEQRVPQLKLACEQSKALFYDPFVAGAPHLDVSLRHFTGPSATNVFQALANAASSILPQLPAQETGTELVGDTGASAIFQPAMRIPEAGHGTERASGLVTQSDRALRPRQGQTMRSSKTTGSCTPEDDTSDEEFSSIFDEVNE